MPAAESELTSADGLPMHAVTWSVDEPRALVAIVHGFGEHIRRYDHVAAALNEAGFSCFGIDLRGHGRSGGLRGHVDTMAQHVGDIAAAIAERRAALGPELPWFLFGHSMGGLTALLYLESGQDQPVAAGISNPLLDIAFDPPAWKTAMGRLLAGLLPKLRLTNELDPSDLCRDASVGEAYVADPLVHDKISTRGFVAMTEGMAEAKAALSRVKTPTWFVLGGADRICRESSGRAAAEALGATILTLPQAYHEAHNGPEQGAVIAGLTSFLEGHLGSND